MAVTLLKHYERFAGLSTDVKPANAPMGSTFFEWDTSQLYTLSPAGWVEKKGTIHGDVQLSGSKLAEQKTQANAVANIITFTENISTIEIYHTEATWQSFTVNGITITVPAGGYRTPIAGTIAKTVTIPAGINCIVGRLV